VTTSTHTALLGERMARHGFATRPCRTPAEAAAITTAIQAQDKYATRIGVWSRSRGFDEPAVLRAIDPDRTVVRTWLMRGTIHLVSAQDLRWLVRLIGPAVARKYRTRWAQLGLTDEVLDRCVAALPDLLADGPLSRNEVRSGLAERGIVLDHPDPALYNHMLLHATTVGLVCRGEDRGQQNSFALLDEWVPDAPEGPSGDDALAELARRYFRAYSPATAADFGTWSGLAFARAVALIRDELTPTDVDGRPGFRLGEVEPARGVRLLPAFDNYLIGYRDRAAMVAPERQSRIYQGGWIRPVVLEDGRAVGTWALDRPSGRVTVEPFGDLSGRVWRAVEDEVDDLGRFLERQLTLVRG
jgi:Winged helix DNA-binding domain